MFTTSKPARTSRGTRYVPTCPLPPITTTRAMCHLFCLAPTLGKPGRTRYLSRAGPCQTGRQFVTKPPRKHGASQETQFQQADPSRRRPHAEEVRARGRKRPFRRRRQEHRQAEGRGGGRKARARRADEARRRRRQLLGRRHRGAGRAGAGPPPSGHVHRRHRRKGPASPFRRGHRQRHGRGGRRPRELDRGAARGR